MRRREFITLLGGTAAAWPFAARAQKPVVPVIGFLNLGSPGNNERADQFRLGLRVAGFVEGQDVEIDFRWANWQPARVNALVDDLARRQVGVIVSAGGSLPAVMAKRAPSTIPIVMVAGDDPVESGLVASLNHPSGNVTGVIYLAADLGGKRLSLLGDLVPQATTVAFLSNMNNLQIS